ncbi:trypsin alpha-3 [Drosophila ficusphila]|uniref:trypsin alpha-3 n=1 Tax=Drosophila ficusphila TaxID=30025 RepID=UPI0007E720C9|nr:trypsin alpha-3 [Drosophila ficusphila]
MEFAVESVQLLLLIGVIRCGRALHLGTPVQQQSFGYVLQIYDPRFLAAGSLFSARYVLTVAHCFRKNTKPEQLTVRAGHDRIAREFGKGRPVAGLLRHPRFSPQTLRNDIAVLRVKVAIGFSRSVNYIPLCSLAVRRGSVEPPPVVAGWSLMNINQPLKSISVTVEPDKSCLPWFAQLPAGVFCASTERERGEGLCYGDSGDPLISSDEVCGLAIGFRRCGDKRYPALFTDVHYHRNFIAQAVLTLDRVTAKTTKGSKG